VALFNQHSSISGFPFHIFHNLLDHAARPHPLRRRPRHRKRESIQPSRNRPSDLAQHTAAAFASKGLTHIILLSRNTQRLENEDTPFITSAFPDINVSTLRLDLADLDSIPGVLKEVDSLTKDDNVEVVFFNAARIKPSGVLDVGVGEIEEDFKVRCSVPDSRFRK
jgi:hypothetical protein